jgi:hypothetical protein
VLLLKASLEIVPMQAAHYSEQVHPGVLSTAVRILRTRVVQTPPPFPPSILPAGAEGIGSHQTSSDEIKG